MLITINCAAQQSRFPVILGQGAPFFVRPGTIDVAFPDNQIPYQVPQLFPLENDNAELRTNLLILYGEATGWGDLIGLLPLYLHNAKASFLSLFAILTLVAIRFYT